MKSKAWRKSLSMEALETRRVLNADLAAITVYHEDFESGDGGFAIDNSGGTYQGLWHYSVGRRSDGLPNHSPDHSFYYGRFETATGGGRYDVVPGDHQGRIHSPSIQLPTVGETTFTFNYLLGTRPELDVDFVDVFVDDGTTTTQLLSRQNGTLPETAFTWHTAEADLTPFNGQAVQIIFSFNTGEYPLVDPEGWYIDDIEISNLPPSVSGYKWNDANGDAAWDDSETGLAGWTIYVDENDNQTRDPDELWTTTNEDGFYFLELELEPNQSVVIREELPSDWVQTFPGSIDFGYRVTDDDLPLTGTSGAATAGNFGNVAPDILGYAWHDTNADGVWDADEAALNDWTVYLDLNRNEQRDDDEPTSVTSNDSRHDGVFWFVTDAGTYAIREEMKEGWSQAYPGDPDQHVVSVGEGSGQRTLGEFGEATPPNFGNATDIMLSGTKFYDRGIPNDFVDDEPLPGWQILAYVDVDRDGRLSGMEENDGPAMVATTNDMGQWAMQLAATEDYVVVELLDSGWAQRAPQQEVLAADVTNAALGRFGYAVDSSDGDHAQLDFGNHETATVGGIKFHDLDADGDYQADIDERLANWVMVAYQDLNEDGDLDADERDAGSVAAVTDGEGRYEMELLAVPHILVEVLAPDWLQSSPDTEVLDESIREMYPVVGNGMISRRGYALSLAPGDEAERDFGNLQAGSLQGVKFEDRDGDGGRDANEDLDGDGVLDPGEDLDGDGRLDTEESGLSGWTIELYGDTNADGMLSPGEPKVDEAVTQDDGSYTFAVAPGSWILQEVQQSGWTQTHPAVSSDDCTPEACDGRYAIQLSSAEARDGLDFGNTQTVRLRGEKVLDLNRDGTPGEGETRLPDWQIAVYVDGNADGVLDADELTEPIATAVTDASGAYEIELQQSGNFVVVEITQPGLVQRGLESPGCGVPVIADELAGELGTFGHPVTVVGGGLIEGLDFCNGPNTPGATMEGLTFEDLNRDGVPQSDEPATSERRVAAFEDRNQNGVLDASELVINPISGGIEPLLLTTTNALTPENFTLLFTDGAVPEEGFSIILLAEVFSGETQTVPRTDVLGPGLGPTLPLHVEEAGTMSAAVGMQLMASALPADESVESVRFGAYGYSLFIVPNEQINGLNFGTYAGCTGKRCFLAGTNGATAAAAASAVESSAALAVVSVNDAVGARRSLPAESSSAVVVDAVFAASSAVTEDEESEAGNLFAQLSALPRWYRLRTS